MENITTQVWQLHPNHPDQQIIEKAAAIIKAGGLVAFPTETVYGLGAHGLSSEAVAKIYCAKGRPSDNPLILHVANLQMAVGLSRQLPTAAKLLMETFWPGPLTLVVPGVAEIPREVTGGLDTVAIRMPDHPVALALISAAGIPIAAPSANKSGKPSPTTADHVRTDLAGCIDALLDAGPAGVGLESTVLDLTGAVPVILRPGGVTYEQLKQVLPKVIIDPSVLGEKLPKNQAPRSPGMKYKHYAPTAPMILFTGVPQRVREKLAAHLKELATQGKRVGILASKENIHYYPGEAIVLPLGTRENPATAAASLFELLRQFDKLQVDTILAEGLDTKGIGLAVMNRLQRAATEIVEC
ncbi:L-threonylcarbamoyladenylate synthase [Desulforamulus aeronauticus]|uniref:Threonylcarbamoyl-AMP synthase n=1 Tax=Desulforamulus aeronauticus DSM 10349 TaxID=1121421 RepID=A0A1M6T2H1_9FIRM|nr:L-threonylcarbamoyladenylate synthase [Desulforamulus aeronauticus]SHK51165.1 translation factor SUA5 [Desulforamulus aeronauticus DSM 10349]